MLAAHDQENLVVHRQSGKTQGNGTLAPKTPGARYPKTPLKIPLNDENGPHAFGGGKSVLQPRARGTGAENALTVSKGDKSIMVTPSETRSRAPLGNKTTNAKAKPGGPGGVVVKDVVKELEKTQLRPTTVRPQRQKAAQSLAPKLEVHSGIEPVSDEPEVEYAPPNVPDAPYESDVFPAGVLTLEALRPENRFRGYHRHYFDPVDEDGVSRKDRELDARIRKAASRLDEQAKADLENIRWGSDEQPSPAPTGGPDASSSKPRSAQASAASRLPPPATVVARKAASALSMAPPSAAARKPLAARRPAAAPARQPSAVSYLLPRAVRPASKPSAAPLASRSVPNDSAVAATSRSTIGYTKGRSVLQLKQQAPPPPAPPLAGAGAAQGDGGSGAAEVGPRRRCPLPRTLSTASAGSDTTITPARYAEEEGIEAAKKPGFLAIFDARYNEDEDNEYDDILRQRDILDDLDEEFELRIEEQDE